ncbi:MAG TPA: response regulator transcription factor [Bacteroidia bacterium]|nr:response regulator transcription factor [Bacteroidia bacterium]
MKIKVVVFDDNKTLRDGLQMMISLSGSLECIGAFTDCRNVVNVISELQPDVVLMDIDMPYVDGLQGLNLLRKKFPDLKIIMQTVFEDDDKIFAAICAGADGYLLKRTQPHDLIKGIIEVMEGGAPMTPIVARQVLRLFNNKNNIPKSIEKFELTARELEILGYLVKGLSYKMIAEKCFVSFATISTHVRHIYEKLQVHSVSAAVAKALEHKIF